MAKFDETKVINALHTDKAVVGKRYCYANSIVSLMREVTREDMPLDAELQKIGKNAFLPFIVNGGSWQYIYPYEEPPKQRMTYRQLSEWLAKGNGEYHDSSNKNGLPMSTMTYSDERRDKPVHKDYVIRTWDSEEWVAPTVDIYERDCKGVKE